MTPHRIQRKRTRGWKMPPNSIYVGRPTRWGNPAVVYSWAHTHLVCRDEVLLTRCDDKRAAMEQAVNYYKDMLNNMSESERDDFISPLRGKNPACWCALDEPCHADILLELANRKHSSNE